MKNSCWKGVFKLGMQSLALRRGSGGQCLLFEEIYLGGEIIFGAALELCYCGGVLPLLKPLPVFRELQLLGKAAGTGEAKVSTWQRSSASVLHTLARPKTQSSWSWCAGACRRGEWEAIGTASREQLSTEVTHLRAPGFQWGILNFWLFLCHHPHDSAKATHLPNSNCSVWTRSEQGRSSQVLNRGCLPFQGDSLVWCHVAASSRKDKGVEMRICSDTAVQWFTFLAHFCPRRV